MSRRSRLLVSLAIFLAVAASAASAEEAIYRLRLGQFTPDGGGGFWNAKQEVFAGSAEKLEDVTYGLDWNYPLGQGLGVQLGGSYFDGSGTFETLEDADFTGSHDVEMNLLSATVLLTYMGPESWRVRPWVGIGGGIHSWELIEEGRTLDDEGEPTTGRFRDSDLTLGFTAAAGVDFWIQRNWGFSVDARQHWVEVDPSGSLEGRGKLDLSGLELALGFGWTF